MYRRGSDLVSLYGFNDSFGEGLALVDDRARCSRVVSFDASQCERGHFVALLASVHSG